MKRPLLHVFTTSYQEVKTIMELITFYRERIPNCLITVYDNMSDDNTEQICKENNVEFIQFDTNGKMDEKTLIELRNNNWKNSEANYIIVCDSDELVDITEKELLDNLENPSWTVSKCKGVELFGNDKFFKDAYYGVYSEGYSKKVLFLKDAIESMNFEAGSHKANPTPNLGFGVIYNENPPKLYHTKWQDFEEGITRQNMIKNKGVSEDSKKKGWNFHYNLSDNIHKDYWQNGFNNRIKIR